MGATVKTLWILFIAGQIFNAGNMNYAQENGYYEKNSFIYGKHPTANQIYKIKVLECVVLYGLTKAIPKYEKPMLAVANEVVWGMIYTEYKTGISISVRL